MNLMEKERPFFYQEWIQILLKRLLFVKSNISSQDLFFQTLFYIGLLIWGISFLDETDFANDWYGATDSFLHNIHLAFHEAGHLIFSLFGEFIAVFGGTLMQSLIPILIMAKFIQEKDNFGASVGLWLFGQNFLDIAPYIYDAHGLRLELVGGGTGQTSPGTHDWRYLLSATNSLDSYAKIAAFTANMGIFFLLLSFVWGGCILYNKFRILQARGFKSETG